MTRLKQLSALYLVAASAFAATVVLDRHPALDRAVHEAGDVALQAGGTAAGALRDHMLQPGWTYALAESGRVYDFVTGPETAAPAHKTELAKVKPAPKAPALAPQKKAAKPVRVAALAKPAPKLALSNPPALRPQIVPERPPLAPPAHVTIAVKPVREALAAPKVTSRVTIDIAPPPQSAGPTDPAEIARVEERLKDNLTDALYDHFDLFLYVSKAAKGPVAQRMYVFAKNPPGGFTLRYDWPVSTGREKVEYNKAGWKLPSFTPAGYYELDPRRMYSHYRSIQWGTPMPYAMFFNWVHDGNRTGLAIHAAHGKDIALLGQRASGGCVHLSPEDARTLFHLIRKDYKGQVPRFAYDRRTRTISNHGQLMRGTQGKLRFYKGYKVLVFIENYGGGADTVAALM